MNNNPSNEASIREEIDKLIVAHNVYIDSVYKGTSDMYSPPETGKKLLSLFAHHQLQLLQRVEDEVLNVDPVLRPVEEDPWTRGVKGLRLAQKESFEHIRISIEKGD